MNVDLVIDPTDLSIREIVDVAVRAEQLGFDAVWTYDHLSGLSLGGRWAHDVWTLLTAVASATDRVQVGPLVSNLTTRHPAYVALAAASLQDLSQGRAMLGVGAGAGPESPYSREVSMMGMTPRSAASRRAIVEDAIGAIRALWNGDRAYVSGNFQLSDVSSFLQPVSPPPIIVGSNGPKMCALAARVADGVNLHYSEKHLDEMVADTRSKVGDRPFLITVEAQLKREWLGDPDAVLRRLEAIGVDRLMLAWHGADGADALTASIR